MNTKPLSKYFSLIGTQKAFIGFVIGLLFGLSFNLDCYAQNVVVSQPPQSDSLQMVHYFNLHQDSKIDLLLAKRMEYNKKSSLSNFGYRLLLYSGKERKEAYNSLTAFKQLFPHLETYMTYSFPNFKLQAGDFKLKEDALKIADEVKRQLDLDVILIPQKIDINKLYQAY